MSSGLGYQPCFGAVPQTWSGRWEALREFTRRWHGVSLGPVGQHSEIVDREQSKVGIALAPSFRECVVLPQCQATCSSC